MTARTNHPFDMAAPWSLHFDRDGTEDIAIICDGNGDDLATSRCFWLPEGADPIPPTLAAMAVMVAAPKLLAALIGLADQIEQDCPIELRSRRVLEALEQAREAIAEPDRVCHARLFTQHDFTSAGDPAVPVPFDDYEVHGVREFEDESGKYCEQVPDDEAEFWSLYGHVPDQGVLCIGNFKTRQFAEEVFARITGRVYTENRKAG